MYGRMTLELVIARSERRSNPRPAEGLYKFYTVLFALYSLGLLSRSKFGTGCCAAHTTRLAPRNDALEEVMFLTLTDGQNSWSFLFQNRLHFL